MSIHPTDLHAAIQAHLDASGESMRALSLRAGLSPKGVSDILHRPGLRPTHRTVALLSTAIGVSLPAPEVGARQTYAELIARLEGADDPSGRSRKMAGRLRWLVRAAGWVAETREVDRGEVIAFFSQNRPATFDLGAGSFATYKSDVLAAIDGGRRRARGRDVRDVGDLHRELHEQVRDCQALPQDLRIVGGAFLVYLHDQGIAPCQVTTEVLAEYHAHRRATGVKDEAACTKHVKRVAALLARLRTLPEFARFAVAAPPHPFADGRLKYGGGDVDAVIAPLMEEFDARVGPWARGEVSSTGLSRAAFVAELDARRAKARPGGKKPLQQRDRRGRRKGKVKLGARAEELRRRGFLLPDERWTERTLANRRAFVAAAAKALVADQDYVIETLEELTDPETVEAIADVLEEANEGEHASEYVATGVKAIRKIARGLLGRSPEDISRSPTSSPTSIRGGTASPRATGRSCGPSARPAPTRSWTCRTPCCARSTPRSRAGAGPRGRRPRPRDPARRRPEPAPAALPRPPSAEGPAGGRRAQPLPLPVPGRERLATGAGLRGSSSVPVPRGAPPRRRARPSAPLPAPDRVAVAQGRPPPATRGEQDPRPRADRDHGGVLRRGRRGPGPQALERVPQ